MFLKYILIILIIDVNLKDKNSLLQLILRETQTNKIYTLILALIIVPQRTIIYVILK